MALVLKPLFEISLLTALMLGLAPAWGGTFKWVDEKGMTHYGDTLPPEYANRGTTELNNRGMVIRKSERALTPDEIRARDGENERKRADAAKLAEQRRTDMALLNTYTSNDEIGVARSRNLQQLDGQIATAQAIRASIERRLAPLRAQAAQVKANGRPTPPGLVEDIQSAQRELSTADQRLVTIQRERQDVIRRFDAEARRFRELTQAVAKN